MTVSPTSYQALAVANALTMVARSATFQAAASIASEAAARGAIINSHGGAPPKSGGIGKGNASDGTTTIDLEAGTYAIVGMASLVPTLAGVGYWDRDGAIGVEVVIPRILSGESPADSSTRAHNVIGGICTDIEAQFGSAGCLAQGTAEPTGIDMSDETGANQNHTTGYIAISFIG